MMYPLHITLIVFLVWVIGRKQPDQQIYYISFFLKMFAGMALGIIFKTFFGAGDTFAYYEAAQLITEPGFDHWWHVLGQAEIGPFPNQPRAIMFVKIISGILMLTKGNYWVISSYLSLISFLAFWYLYRQVRTTLPNIKWPVVIGFLLLPSAVFWSAGIMKGALTNASIAFLTAICLKLFYRKQMYWYEFVLVAIAGLLLYFIKYYLLIILLPAILYALFDRRALKAGLTKPVRAIVYLAILAGSIFIAPQIDPNLRVDRLPQSIHRNQQSLDNSQRNNSQIDLMIEPTWGSLLAKTPSAIFIGLFGPTIFDTTSPWGWIPKIENLLIFGFTLWSIFLLFRQKLFDPDILVIASGIFILVLAAMLPLAAPNFGALVRYKAPLTPFLVTLVTILPCWWIQKRRQNN